MKWIIGIGAVTAAAAIALLLDGTSAPGLLNLVNRMTPGDRGVRQIASSIAYGDHARHKLDVYRAGGSPREALPVLVFFYGGGWDSGQREDYGFVAEAYAAQGFLVVLPDYRLVPEVRFPAFVEDGAAAVRWARDHAARLGGDPERIVLAGHSAGAYIAAMLALDPRWLGGDVTIRAVAGLAGPYDFHPFTTEAAIAAFGAEPDPRATQPIRFARDGAPPLWLATGSADETVKPRNSHALAGAQGRFGTIAEYREYLGLDHSDLVMALARPFRSKAPVLAESAAFLKRHAAPRQRGTIAP